MPDPGWRGAGRWSIFDVAVWGVAVLATVAFAVIFGSIVWHGIEVLRWDFLTSAPENAGRAGGVGPLIVSTLWIVGVCLVVAIPVGLATALLLAEYAVRRDRLAQVVRRSLDTLAGFPSIAFGLFGNVFFCHVLGLGFSILSGGLTLACMVLPILVRVTEEGLRAVPTEYRAGAAALGFSRTSAVFHLLLPLAVPSVIVGAVLGIGRAIAETAALIFTSGYVDRMPESMMDSGRALSVHIYDLSMNIAGGDKNAYGTALLLIIILFLINALATGISRQWQKTKVVDT